MIKKIWRGRDIGVQKQFDDFMFLPGAHDREILYHLIRKCPCMNCLGPWKQWFLATHGAFR